MPGRLRESAAPRRKAVAGQVLSDSVLLRQRHNFVSEAHWRIAFPAMYTKDALLFPDDQPPVTGGPEAIKQFWVKTIKAGFKDHTFKIITTRRDGKIAYVVSSWTVAGVDEKGAKATYSGNTIRILERQSDGTWRTKVHMYASDR